MLYEYSKYQHVFLLFSNSKMILVCTFSLFCSLISFVLSHPQCLDFHAPFKPDGQLSFCEQYQEFGCCSPENASTILAEYLPIAREARKLNLPTVCDSHVEDILCQKCSPYAAHIYEVEETRGKPRPFPSLCPQFCTNVYESCSPLLHLVSSSQNFQSSSEFCKFVSASDSDYCYPNLLSNNVLSGLVSRKQTTQEGCICLEEFPAGLLRFPLLLRHAGDGTKRVFIGDRGGEIYVYSREGVRHQKPFLDISSNVTTTDSPGEERGLLGLAFHPQFITNRRFFVFYSARKADKDEYVRVSEFLVREDNKNEAEESSEKVLLEVRQPYWNHNGGELLFGDDNYLYISLGDGGTDDELITHYAQDNTSLLGKMLRIDVDRPSFPLSYSIPADNPFASSSQSQVRKEIYAYGLRNVWRCGKDRGDENGLHKGRVICGDVGQSAFEEVDILKKGGNFGWNAKEGFECYNDEICGEIENDELPIYSYPHSVGKSVIGGHVYRGCLNPNFYGLYFYGDHTNGMIARLKENNNGSWSNQILTTCGNDVCMNGLTGQYPPNIMTFGEDEDGELYVVTTQLQPITAALTGKVYRIVDPRRRGDPQTCKPARYGLSSLSTQPTQPTKTPRPRPPPRPPGPTRRPVVNKRPPSAAPKRRNSAMASLTTVHVITVTLTFLLTTFIIKPARCRYC